MIDVYVLETRRIIYIIGTLDLKSLQIFCVVHSDSSDAWERDRAARKTEFKT